MEKEKMSLYVHIPFCKQKCNYCDFLSFTASNEIKKRYVSALINEIEYISKKYQKYQIRTVFIGGGTPSLLEKGDAGRILAAIYECFDVDIDAEITIETNPGTLSEEKIVEYKESHINRISMGLQSAKDDELRLLGRIHNYQTFEENYQMLRKYGFENINIDLISGLPGQCCADFEYSLKKVIELKPQHISVYGLIIEEETPFYNAYGPSMPFEDMLPDECDERKMYHNAIKMLNDEGYKHYEISNFALKGKECKHNIVYWKRDNYLGIGLGASSMVENIRFKNTTSLQAYFMLFGADDTCTVNDRQYQASLCEYEILERDSMIEEYMILGLRLTEGICMDEFYNTFKIDFFDVPGYKEHTEKMCENELLIMKSNRLRLTEKGLDLANYVMQGYCIV